MGNCGSQQAPQPVAVTKAAKDATPAELKDVVKAYYTAPFAPNPMLVDIFMREKGLDPESVENPVDVVAAANRSEEGLKKNPNGQVPYIELTDGTVVQETIAICEFLDERLPGAPQLIGRSAVERARTRAMQRRLEEHFVYPTFYGFRFWTASDDCEGMFKGFFAERNNEKGGSILIPHAYKEMQEWGVRQLKWLEAQKQAEGGKPSDYICGPHVTIVDIQAYSTLHFFGGAGQPCGAEVQKLPWLSAWFDRMKARASVVACVAHIEALQKAAAEAAEKEAKKE